MSHQRKSSTRREKRLFLLPDNMMQLAGNSQQIKPLSIHLRRFKPTVTPWHNMRCHSLTISYLQLLSVPVRHRRLNACDIMSSQAWKLLWPSSNKSNYILSWTHMPWSLQTVHFSWGDSLKRRTLQFPVSTSIWSCACASAAVRSSCSRRLRNITQKLCRASHS